jgi:hypothetical protein
MRDFSAGNMSLSQENARCYEEMFVRYKATSAAIKKCSSATKQHPLYKGMLLCYKGTSVVMKERLLAIKYHFVCCEVLPVCCKGTLPVIREQVHDSL